MRQVRATVRITGRVQGVNFRYFTQRTAIDHQVSGCVRNLPNGDVEAIFEGRESMVRKVVDWCRQGPSAADVEEVLVDWEDYQGEFEDFRVLR